MPNAFKKIEFKHTQLHTLFTVVRTHKSLHQTHMQIKFREKDSTQFILLMD